MKSCLFRQQGLSLISLLIGLFISMLCILAGLTLYKNTLVLSTSSKIDAQHDGQIAAALLTLQLELQNAGYGAAPADGPHAVSDSLPMTFNGAAITVPLLAWRYSSNLDTVFTCRGALEFPSTDITTGITYRNLALITLNTADGCTSNAALKPLGWLAASASDAKTTIIGRWPVFEELAVYLQTAPQRLFTFGALTAATCSPYGALISTEQHLQVTITAPSGATLNGASGAVDHSGTFCLLNTYP